MKTTYRFLLIFLMTISIFNSRAETIRALFLGNSYTAAHNLPQLIASIAQSCGDTLVFSSNTPGGYTFQQHSTNAQSIGLIQQGNWDYLILQEQSQLPSFPSQQVLTQCFPYAKILDSIFNANNPCGETVFYRTWGRKNGDSQNCPSWPPVCTYEGMDSLLHMRYRIMADSFNAVLAPAGSVWKYIREQLPSIELYDGDGSHPSAVGAMATALTFYTIIFRKDPSPNTYFYTISSSDYAACLNSVNLMVRDSLNIWNVGKYDPISSFNWLETQPGQISFTNTSQNSSIYYWDFGDGYTSNDQNPIHIYLTPGTYQVTLKASHCQLSDTSFQNITASPVGINESEPEKVIICPNPAINILNLNYSYESIRNHSINIFDLQGRKLLETNLDASGNTEINIENLNPGIYFLGIGIKRFQFIKL